MSYSRIAFWCAYCKRNTHHYQPDINHTAHLLAALMTFGLWLIIYLVLCIMREPWTCEECGRRESTIYQVRKPTVAISPPTQKVLR